MDSHIIGPRGGEAYGAVVSAHGVRVAFGDAEQAGKDLFRTNGASPTNPLFLRVTGTIPTAFDAVGADAKITMSDLDGSNDEDVATLAAETNMVMLTSDKIIELVYTEGVTGTEGEVGYLIELVGPGKLELNL